MEATFGIDPEKLLLRISQGEELSSEEVAEITEVFRSLEIEDIGRSRSVDEVYSFLVVVGRARLIELQHLIEKSLDVRDALTVALVLETLCLEWEKTGEYLERVINFALGVAWDEDQDVQQVAIKILGEYLQQFLPAILSQDVKSLSASQHRVLDLLMSIFEDESLESWTRQSAYYSLCRSYGKDWEVIPSECVQLEFSHDSKDVEWGMIDELKELLSQPPLEEEGSSSLLRSIDSGSSTGPGMR